MSGPAPVVAKARLAVAELLSSLALKPADLVLVACSGGPDSLALAAVAAFVCPRFGLAVGAVVVDHGIDPQSGLVAQRAAATCQDLGLAPVRIVPVVVPTGSNLEARARSARYAAFEQVLAESAAKLVLLGHTMDDQAESVLLGLARGSGSQALAGMPVLRDRYARPLLGLRRQETAAICQALGLQPWQDPANQLGGPYPSRRTEVRHRLMPELEQVLGPGLVPALARSAAALALDNQLLDSLADALLDQVGGVSNGLAQVDCRILLDQTAAIRRRVLYKVALRWGADPTSLGSSHVDALEKLVTNWHGQGPTMLPGGLSIERVKTSLRIASGPFTKTAAKANQHPIPVSPNG
ncbi:MAG: tRNA lysidine(34) synthetase TilS [Bifidobacteriaceae bacterium]|nr:tRNA lysidine(34) synthetase TilS [Bifidobacteriaceae bacterium]